MNFDFLLETSLRILSSGVSPQTSARTESIDEVKRRFLEFGIPDSPTSLLLIFRWSVDGLSYWRIYLASDPSIILADEIKAGVETVNKKSNRSVDVASLDLHSQVMGVKEEKYEDYILGK